MRKFPLPSRLVSALPAWPGFPFVRQYGSEVSSGTSQPRWDISDQDRPRHPTVPRVLATVLPECQHW